MKTAGSVTWHSSSDDDGPDVGIEVRLSESKNLYAGEMAGHADWVLAIIEGDAMLPFASVSDHDAARDAIDAIAAALAKGSRHDG